MQKVTVLHWKDFEECSYHLIGINANCEDYKLAYLINQHLQFRFQKHHKDIELIHKGHTAYFSNYVFDDEDYDAFYNLISNKYKFKTFNKNSFGLFQDNSSFEDTCVYLLPNNKKADFLLKINEEKSNEDLSLLTHKINQIKGVTTSFIIDTTNLKYKENLIF